MKSSDLNTTYTDYNLPFTPPRTPGDDETASYFSPPPTPSDTEMEEAPSTPKQIFVGLPACPQTPGRARQPRVEGHLFPGALTKRATDNPALQRLTLGSEPLHFFTYRNPMISKSFYVARQPSQNCSCGSGVALMKMLDFGLADTLTDRPAFWERYATVQLTSGADLRDWLKQEGLISAKLHHWIRRPQTCSITEPDQLNFVRNANEMLDHLRQAIKESGQPAIVAIEHPRVDGHWIIVDSISDTQAILRDPFTGLAHRVDKEALAAMIFDEDPNMLSETIQF